MTAVAVIMNEGRSRVYVCVRVFACVRARERAMLALSIPRRSAFDRAVGFAFPPPLREDSKVESSCVQESRPNSSGGLAWRKSP